MIYIKNYRTLNSFIPMSQNENMSDKLQLLSLIGKTVIIFVDSGGKSGKGFTGLLTEVFSDRIKLITKMPSAPVYNKNRNNCNCYYCRRRRRHSNFGINTVIMTAHITAIVYNYF